MSATNQPKSSSTPVEPRIVVAIDGREVPNGETIKYMAPGHFCPDVLDLQDLGEADFLRGRVVRAFMWLMEFWPKKRR